jgi:hypothetical protein
MRRRPAVKIIAALLMGANIVTGCASAPSGTEGATPSTSHNVLSREEILEQAPDAMDAYEVLQQLRPTWLSFPGLYGQQPSISLSIQGERQPRVMDSLRRIPAERIRSIRHSRTGGAGSGGIRIRIYVWLIQPQYPDCSRDHLGVRLGSSVRF